MKPMKKAERKQSKQLKKEIKKQLTSGDWTTPHGKDALEGKTYPWVKIERFDWTEEA
jgi:hypothetical protein